MYMVFGRGPGDGALEGRGGSPRELALLARPGTRRPPPWPNTTSLGRSRPSQEASSLRVYVCFVLRVLPMCLIPLRVSLTVSFQIMTPNCKTMQRNKALESKKTPFASWPFTMDP